MAEEIVIGKLILDSSDLENSMASSKKAIIDLENEQKKLKKETENLSTANEDQLKTFVANETELKKIKAEYAANQKSVLELTKAQTGLDSALSQQNKTQKDAIANTAALTAARRQIDATTIEGAKAIADINAKIDKNNEFVKENSSQQEKAATISGNYRQKIFELGNSFGGASANAIGFVQQGREILGSLKDVNDSVVASARNVIGFGNASKAAAVQEAQMSTVNTTLATTTEAVGVAEQGTTKATWLMNAALGTLLLPITLIVAAIALGITVFKQFQPAVDAVENALAALKAVFSVITNTITQLVTGTKSLGEAFSGLGGDMNKAAKEAIALTEAQRELGDAQAAQELITARNRAEINKLNVELKNRTKSEQERAVIAEKIIAKEKEDFEQRKKLVDEEVRQARQVIAIKAGLNEAEKKILKEQGAGAKDLLESKGGLYDAELEALNKARLKSIALEDENTVNLEKVYARRDKIQDEAAASEEKRQAAAKAATEKRQANFVKNAQNEIEILKLQSKERVLSADQQIELAQKIFDKENELAKKTASGSDLQKQLITNRQNLSSAVLEIAQDQINKETEAQKAAIAKNKELTKAQYDDQASSAEALAFAQTKLLDSKLLSEKAYAEEVKSIEASKNEALLTLKLTFDEAEKVRNEKAKADLRALEQVEFEIRMQDIIDRDATEQEIRQALIDEAYTRDKEALAQNLEDKKISEKEYYATLALYKKQYDSDTKRSDKILVEQKRATNLNLVKDGISALQSLFGESKALAVASALVNTYEGITAALKAPTQTQRIIGVAFATATGFGAVKNILKTEKGSGATTAPQQTTSGAGGFVNTAQTETVAKVSEAPQQQNTIVTPPVLILENLLEAQNNLAVKVASS